MDKKDVLYEYNRLLLSHKKNEILPFSTTSINLRGFMLTEISQIKANIEGYHLHVESKK